MTCGPLGLACAALFGLAVFAAGSASAEDAPASKRVEALLARMTIEEKVGQLNLLSGDNAVTGPYTKPAVTEAILKGDVGGVFNVYGAAYLRILQETAVTRTRLGIPLLLGMDVVHGHRTLFPVPLGQAASFDLDAIRDAERIAAREAAASGINWVYAPMLDVTRDPRWGRIVEGGGESTWLGAKIAAARIAGLQGTRLDAADSVAACAKHYGANGAVEAGRDYSAAAISERALREFALPPFRAAVAAGVACVMAAFNTFDGIPAVANRRLLDDILRGEWRFSGLVVSDFGSIGELTVHGVAGDGAEAAARALRAGTDIDMMSETYRRELPRLVRAGRVSAALLDRAVRRVLALKERLGLFDDPYARMDPEREAATLLAPEHRAAALALAEKSLVLLKNENGILPFSRGVRRIAVIGPLGDDAGEIGGPWPAAGKPKDTVTVAAGIRSVVPEARVEVVRGGAVDAVSPSEIEMAVAAARAADAVVLVLGERALQSGEAASRTDLGLPGGQLGLARAVLAAKKPTAVVLFHGRPLVLTELATEAPALLAAWFPGTMGGLAVARTLFGENEPRGRLPVTFPRSVGQIPIYHDRLPTGRPPTNPPQPYTSGYLDEATEPLFPFGFGLGYTTFAFGPPRLDRTLLGAGQRVTVSVDVTNTGSRPGQALVQLYLRDPVAEVSRPVMELRGFHRLALAPGKSGTVVLTLREDDLAYWHADGRFAADPGRFIAMTGPDSAALQSAEFIYRPE